MKINDAEHNYVYKITFADSFDDTNMPKNIHAEFYCESEEDAELIVDLLGDFGKGKGGWMMERLPLLNYSIVFNHFISKNFGSSFDDKTLN